MSASAEVSAEPVASMGCVEARTADRVLGWAWDPASPDERLTVALLDGDRMVAESRADRPREDLARNGVGDDAHAFELAVPEALCGQSGRLVVRARAADGRTVVLWAPLPVAGDAASLLRLQRGLEQIAVQQRLILRNLRAIPNDDALARLTSAQARLEEQIATLEVFVARLDERLAALAAREAKPPASRRMHAVAAGFGVLAVTAWAMALVPLL